MSSTPPGPVTRPDLDPPSPPGHPPHPIPHPADGPCGTRRSQPQRMPPKGNFPGRLARERDARPRAHRVETRTSHRPPRKFPPGKTRARPGGPRRRGPPAAPATHPPRPARQAGTTGTPGRDPQPAIRPDASRPAASRRPAPHHDPTEDRDRSQQQQPHRRRRRRRRRCRRRRRRCHVSDAREIRRRRPRCRRGKFLARHTDGPGSTRCARKRASRTRARSPGFPPETPTETHKETPPRKP